MLSRKTTAERGVLKAPFVRKIAALRAAEQSAQDSERTGCIKDSSVRRILAPRVRQMLRKAIS